MHQLLQASSDGSPEFIAFHGILHKYALAVLLSAACGFVACRTQLQLEEERAEAALPEEGRRGAPGPGVVTHCQIFHPWGHSQG